MTVLMRLQGIFREYFDDEALVLREDTSPEDIEGWDSLAQITVIVMCEAEFGVKFSLDDVAEITDAGSIADIVARKL